MKSTDLCPPWPAFIAVSSWTLSNASVLSILGHTHTQPAWPAAPLSLSHRPACCSRPRVQSDRQQIFPGQNMCSLYKASKRDLLGNNKTKDLANPKTSGRWGKKIASVKVCVAVLTGKRQLGWQIFNLQIWSRYILLEFLEIIHSDVGDGFPNTSLALVEHGYREAFQESAASLLLSIPKEEYSEFCQKIQSVNVDASLLCAIYTLRILFRQ